MEERIEVKTVHWKEVLRGEREEGNRTWLIMTDLLVQGSVC